MRFLRRNNIKKTIIVISDLHLGAGVIVGDRRNFLEDFHVDKELVEFLDYYSNGQYRDQEVELIINGDFFDLLSVPFVPFFDDEFWSEKAAVEKLKMAMAGHPEVMTALKRFVSRPKKNLLYILGNHDGELILEQCRNTFLETFPEESRTQVQFYMGEEYWPIPEVVIKHGHHYELAHKYDLEGSIIRSNDGENYFLPPWGSYYVTQIVNKFKAERGHVHSVKPIRTFLIWGLMFDTLFTLRFMFANAYYFIMVRLLSITKEGRRFNDVVKYTMKELELFHDLEDMVQEYFEERPNVRALIVGHTHEATFKTYPSGASFINTGTWTKMYNLDFSKKQDGLLLTYAQIDISDKNHETEEHGAGQVKQSQKSERLSVALNVWQGTSNLPYREF